MLRNVDISRLALPTALLFLPPDTTPALTEAPTAAPTDHFEGTANPNAAGLAMATPRADSLTTHHLFQGQPPLYQTPAAVDLVVDPQIHAPQQEPLQAGFDLNAVLLAAFLARSSRGQQADTKADTQVKKFLKEVLNLNSKKDFFGTPQSAKLIDLINNDPHKALSLIEAVCLENLNLSQVQITREHLPAIHLQVAKLLRLIKKIYTLSGLLTDKNRNTLIKFFHYVEQQRLGDLVPKSMRGAYTQIAQNTLIADFLSECEFLHVPHYRFENHLILLLTDEQQNQIKQLISKQKAILHTLGNKLSRIKINTFGDLMEKNTPLGTGFGNDRHAFLKELMEILGLEFKVPNDKRARYVPPTPQ